MDDNARDRLDDAVDDLLERNREAMRQHGELGGTTNNDELAPDESDQLASDVSDDPLRAEPGVVERALDHMRRRAVERARAEDDEPSHSEEIPGE